MTGLASDVADVVQDVKEGPVDPVPQVTSEQQQAATMAWVNGGTSAPAAQVSGDTDSAGEVWDGSVHSEKRSKTSDGRWRRKRGAGASPRRTLRHDTPMGTANGVEPITPLDAAPEIRPLAEATVVTFTGMLTMVGGEGWNAESHETSAMINAWENYYRARGIRELPPELMLFAVMGTYIGKRAMREENLEGFQRFAARFTRGRMIPNARPDTRQNGSRQVDVAASPIAGVSRQPRTDGVLHDSPERL